jgi:hypothetical protein
MKLSIAYVAGSLIAGAGLMASATAQEGIKRTPLGTMDFPPGYQTVKVYGEIAKGTCADRHTIPESRPPISLRGRPP